MDYDDLLYDEVVGDPGYLAPWRFTKANEAAMRDVLAAVEAYPPGQAGIDGGGWKVIRREPAYVYVQYESLLKGFRDDVEFAILKDGELSVRSSSRVGRQDYLVNAKRLNWFASALNAAGGWTASPISAETHPVYWNENTTPQSRAADMRAMRPEGSTR